MSRTQAIGSDAVMFYRRDGVLVEIPLTEIYFDAGAIHTDHVLDPDSTKLPDWLAYLAARGVLKEAPTPPSTTSLIARAAKDGPGGNHIEVNIATSTGDATKVDITVTQFDTYEALTLGNLNIRLGTSTVAGTDVGLLRVRTNTPDAPAPVNRDPIPNDGASPPAWTITDTDPTSKPVILEPKVTGAGFDKTTFHVFIEDAVAGDPTFTLRVECKVRVPNIAFGAATLPTVLSDFRYLVNFTAPPGPPPVGGYPKPRPTRLTLGGGKDVTPAAPAIANLLA